MTASKQIAEMALDQIAKTHPEIIDGLEVYVTARINMFYDALAMRGQIDPPIPAGPVVQDD